MKVLMASPWPIIFNNHLKRNYLSLFFVVSIINELKHISSLEQFCTGIFCCCFSCTVVVKICRGINSVLMTTSTAADVG